MSEIFINAYSSICNLGSSVKEMFSNALVQDAEYFTFDDTIVKGKTFCFGKISNDLPEIDEQKYKLRCNSILLYCLEQIKEEVVRAVEKYGKNRVAIVIGTTNSGVDEFEVSKDIYHTQIGNPAGFLHKYLGLTGYYSGVSTACTSGVKAFSTAQKLLQNDICDAVIAGAADSLCKMPVYGFHSLEVLSGSPCIPFSKNRNGINISEGGALFLLEKVPSKNSILFLGTGETSDAYHCASPDPEGIQASKAIENALKNSGLNSNDISYINLHGTGTISNDLMEANAVYRIFQDSVPCSSTKSLTGHCLGASAGVEAALCCAMLDKRINKQNLLLPHKFDGLYDETLPAVSLVSYNQKAENLKYILCNSFGFGGSNAVMILGRYDG